MNECALTQFIVTFLHSIAFLMSQIISMFLYNTPAVPEVSKSEPVEPFVDAVYRVLGVDAYL